MSFLWELIEMVFGQVISAFLFVTGEALHWMVTLGSHRIRRWESQDDNVIWPKMIIGLLFWGAVGYLVWQFAF